MTLHAGTSAQAAALPPQAVHEGPRGRFVYQLDSADRIRAQPVDLLRIQDTLAIVAGLQDGQRIVVEGAAGQLPDGAAVRIASTAGAPR